MMNSRASWQNDIGWIVQDELASNQFLNELKLFFKNRYQNRRVNFSKENFFELEIVNYEKYPE